MFDPFGLRREIEDSGAARESASAPAASIADAPPPSKRFWATLLIVDSLFLLIFGGALASMMLKQWSAPAVSSPVRANKRAEPKKSAPAVIETAPPVPAPAPAPVPEVKKAEPERKPEPAAQASRGPLGRPSVLAPDLPRRSEPALASEHGSGPKQPDQQKTAPSGDKVKAKIVIFSCPGNGAKEVFLKGPFLVRTRGEKRMLKDPDGIWRSSVSLLPGTYKYHCAADGKRSASESIVVE